jgi:endoglucanase
MNQNFRIPFRKLFIIGLMVFVPGLSIMAQASFNKGVNLTNWFQTVSAHQIQFTKFTKQDFINIKSLGCDVVRLPINLHAMTSGTPNFIIDPLFFSFLDSAVNWAEDLQIHLILDNHTFDPSVNTEPGVENTLVKVWKQMAAHYKDHTYYILYEILNEPHGITTQVWGQIQQSAINAIRSEDTKHTIIVGASGYNAYGEMKYLPTYSDTNLLYTFHFYDPFLFTHQGASWVSPSMEPILGIPFPYSAGKMPACPTSMNGTWIESLFNGYLNDGTETNVKSLIDIAVDFKTSRHVKIFCGEFGVYIPNSNNTDRVHWYDVVRKYLNEKGIPWTIWDYTGSFGLFTKSSNESFDHDLNVSLLQSLEFTIPSQSPFIKKPDSTGFSIYSNFIEKSIIESSSTNGTLDFYNTTKPNNGKYCIYWSGCDLYNYIGFDFMPDRDFSRLLSENYALDFFVRGNIVGSKIDVRFLDTKTGSSDHPWRIRYTLDENLVPWDKHWHHVFIPLKNFVEQGAWDNGWFTPEGKFDWKAVDRFEIDSEYSNLIGKDFWFDNICITNLDTAQVRDTSSYTTIHNLHNETNFNLSIYPNPIQENSVIRFYLPTQSDVEFEIFTITGKKIHHLNLKNENQGIHYLNWKNLDANIPKGIYILQLSALNSKNSLKIVQ